MQIEVKYHHFSDYSTTKRNYETHIERRKGLLNTSLFSQLVAVGALVLVEHVCRELPALAPDPHRAAGNSTSSSHCTSAEVYRCPTDYWVLYL